MFYFSFYIPLRTAFIIFALPSLVPNLETMSSLVIGFMFVLVFSFSIPFPLLIILTIMEGDTCRVVIAKISRLKDLDRDRDQ